MSDNPKNNIKNLEKILDTIEDSGIDAIKRQGPNISTRKSINHELTELLKSENRRLIKINQILQNKEQSANLLTQTEKLIKIQQKKRESTKSSAAQKLVAIDSSFQKTLSEIFNQGFFADEISPN